MIIDTLGNFGALELLWNCSSISFVA